MNTTTIHISDILNSQRIDVAYYKDNIKGANFVPLSKYVNIKGGKRIPTGKSFSSENTDYLYLRLSDIEDFECIDYSALKNISEELFNTLKRYEIKNEQIVFSIAGTIGRVFVIKNIPKGKRIILTENCAKLLPKNDTVIPDYVALLLNCSFVQKQIEQSRIQTTIPKIGLDRIAKLRIPEIPLMSIQQEIIGLYSKAQEARLKKNYEATLLLNNIDDYLLEVLHIDRSQQKTHINTSFYRKVSSIIGNRLDTSFYKDKFEMVSTKYPNVKLSSLVEVDPTISFNCFDNNMPISFIPMECIDEQFGEISEYRETTISKTKGYTKFEENDLLWAKITPCMQNGKSAIARNLKNGIGCGSTEYYVMRPKGTNVTIDYIYLFLRHHEILKAAQNSFGGSAGQQRVSSQYLKSIMIPLPDISTQIEITKTITNMKDKAKRLQKEGNALLEESKQIIEKLILR